MVTQQDVTELRTILESGDRGGFYYKYYRITGTVYLILAASIILQSGDEGN